jgi:hypothetical protein
MSVSVETSGRPDLADPAHLLGTVQRNGSFMERTHATTLKGIVSSESIDVPERPLR